MLSLSAYAYDVVHYDDFKYTGNYSLLVNNHEFMNIAGVTHCIASYDGLDDHRLSCGNVGGFAYVAQKFNLVDDSYCISKNYSMNGGARNFSVRGAVRGAILFQPYATGDTFRIYPTTGNLTASQNSYIFFQVNGTGTTRARAYRGAIQYNYFSDAISYSYYTFQIDYYMTNDTLGRPREYTTNISYINPSGLENSDINSAASPVVFNCINTTMQLVQGTNNYLDFISVIVYGEGEPFLPISTPLTDYWYLGENNMPRYSLRTTDKDGKETSSVGITINDCQPTYVNGFIVQSPDECNPLYLDFYDVYDQESDSIEMAYDCGRSSTATDYYRLDDNFTDSLENLLIRYNAQGCNLSVSDLDGSRLGLKFAQGANCSLIESHFDNAYPADNVYLYKNFNVFTELSFTPKDDTRQMLHFTNLAGNSPLIIGMMRNSTTNKFDIFLGDSCCLVSPALAYSTNFTNSSAMTIRLMLNMNTSMYSFMLKQGSNTFYSEPFAFDWSSPLSVLQLYADTLAVPFAPVNRGQVIGDYHMFSTDSLPGFRPFNASQDINCTSGAVQSFDGMVYMTDNPHGDNYLNYLQFTWSTAPLVYDGYVTPETLEGGFDLDDLFLGSATLKYLFALGIISVLSVSMFIIGAMYGSVLAGAVIAMFIDTIAIFILVLLGILPAWFAVVVFMILALAIAFLLSKVIGGGGGDGGG